MSCTGGKVHEKRLVWSKRLLSTHPSDCPRGHIGREVVVLLILGFAHGSCSLDNHRIPLIGFATDESVEFVESRMRWPTIKRSADTHLPGGRFVVLTPSRRRIAVHPKDFGHWSDALWSNACVTRKRGGHFHDRTGVVAVVVVTSQKCRSGGTA